MTTNNFGKGLPAGAYNPEATEKEILDFWLENKFYAPEYKSERTLSTANKEDRETFTIILPPPNANGNLHLGHMSGYAYQDLMGRYNRMKGKKVLLLPGKDHAGIQTEVVFEKELEAKGKTKLDLGRDAFYRACYQFCMKNGANARSQEQKIGLSADFDRELFTLDPKIVEKVLTTFKQMYEDGLVYRGKRLVNWCPRCQSALADIDTEFKDSKTSFVYFKYGFSKPSQKALAIKKEYEGKTIEWSFERNKTSDGKNDLPFAYGHLDNDLEIIGIGYDRRESRSGFPNKLTGRVAGIQMRLDEKYRLVVIDENFQGDIHAEINKIFLFEIKYYAGAHILLFNEVTKDEHYNDGFIMGTVRPETKFGDTAVAVDPDDERYKPFVGKSFEVNTLLGTANINLIADNAVDEEFGTGAVKVTPAHSPEDWDIAQRHPAEALPEKQVIDWHGKLNHMTGKYNGKDALDSRDEIIADMKDAGMLIYVDENYENRIRICERCKHQIEPLISYQWFVDTKDIKAKAKQLVNDGFTEIMPDGMKKTYMEWMNSPEDWCITRQLWWGYRIPVWYKGENKEYITETGEVKETIGGKIMESEEDYKDLMKVSLSNPSVKNFAPILIPGKHGYAYRVIYPEIKSKYIDSQIVQVENLDDPSFADYEKALSQIDFNENSTVITHSLGSQAIVDYLIKNNLKIANLIMLAPSTADSKSYELFVSKGFWTFKDDYSKLKDYVENITVIHSNDDEHAESESFTKFAEMVGAQRIEETGKKHYASKDYDRHSEKLMEELKKYSGETDEWLQDPDVLDTWFSSGQWPTATLSVKSGDFEQFYPTQVMETGWDILLFWVTRMMLLNPYVASKDTKGKKSDAQITPFENVYLHGLVLDKNGVKMSKSKGNGIDPFEMMQKYGTDALRFSFIVGNSPGQNYRLYEEKIASYRNFCNKIWNASKFTLMNLSDVNEIYNQNESSLNLEQEDKDFLDHIRQMKEDSTRRIDQFLFGLAAQELFESFWHKFADDYIEKVKPRLYTKDKEGNPINTTDEAKNSRLAAQWTLYQGISIYLKLLHPFIPFITERVWQELPKDAQEAESLMYSSW